MTRALFKGTGLWLFGRIPGGPRLYRMLTREWFGTQKTHVDKLARVAPGYVEVWRGCGMDLEGASIAILNPGMTSFWPMACRLMSSQPSHHLQLEERMIPRYVEHSVSGVLASLGALPPARASEIAALRKAWSVREIQDRCNATEHVAVCPGRLPLESASVGIFHSGGTLEHFRADDLDGFLSECFRVLRPAGLASHVFDHRDHLYHADKSMEPMNHLRHSEAAYRFLYGHPLLYHNRLSPTEVTARLCETGFEMIAVRRMVLPLGKYVPDEQVGTGLLGCSRLAPRFRAFGDQDLRTAACHYLFRKPSQ